jgi:hypothetical protein
MKLTVRFLGVCLFDLTQAPEEITVYLPNAKANTNLADGKNARPHEAMLVTGAEVGVGVKPTGARQIAIPRSEIQFFRPEGAGEIDHSGLTNLLRVGDAAPGISLAPDAHPFAAAHRAAATLRIDRGRLHVDPGCAARAQWIFEDHLGASDTPIDNPALEVFWEVDNVEIDHVRIVTYTGNTMTWADERLLVTNGSINVVIGNLERCDNGSWPCWEQCRCRVGDVSEDFRWVYRLMRFKQGPSLMARLGGRPAPSPRVYKCVRGASATGYPPSATGPTCFPPAYP